MSAFAPVLVYVLVLIGFVITNMVLTHVLGPRNKTPTKQMAYESGMDPVGDARQPFDVKFYLVAILFLVFDVELLYLYPWAVVAYNDGGYPAILKGPVFWSVIAFIALLLVAYVYDWRKGVFKWR